MPTGLTSLSALTAAAAQYVAYGSLGYGSAAAAMNALDANGIGGWFTPDGLGSSDDPGTSYGGAYAFTNGYFTSDDAAAFAVQNQAGVLVVSFRGSDNGFDFENAVANLAGQVRHLYEFIERVIDYARNPASHVNEIIITGHSLGGQLAEAFAAIYGPRLYAPASSGEIQIADDAISLMTFASPGVPDQLSNIYVSDDGTQADVQINLPYEIFQNSFAAGNTEDPVYQHDGYLSLALLGLSRGTWEFSVYVADENSFTFDGRQDDATNVEWKLGLAVGEHHQSLYYQVWTDLCVAAWYGDYYNSGGYAVYALRSDDEWHSGSFDDVFTVGTTYTGSAILGLSGNDTITRPSYQTGKAFISGGAGYDYVLGGLGSDYVDGGKDGDDLSGYGGADFLWGGSGNDTLDGGDGNDTMYGQADDDYLDGWTGNDELNGGDGADVLYGWDGADELDGGEGADYLYGENGDDHLDGWSGDDKLYGGAGADTLFGWDGVDHLDGGVGNDTLNGEGGADSLFGGDGNDILDGGAAADAMSGGLGNDTYYVSVAGDTTVETSSVGGVDRVYSSVSRALGTNIENLTLLGAAVINGTGNSLSNVMYGNSAANTLVGGGGADTLYGNAGNDRLYGGAGNDYLHGGLGNDLFVFNTALAANRDRIADFSVIHDSIWLENAVFTKLTTAGAMNAANFRVGAAAADANDYIIYNKTNGALLYDSNGNMAGGSVQIATLSANLALTRADFLII